jgi:hypothetical protein
VFYWVVPTALHQLSSVLGAADQTADSDRLVTTA